MDKHNLKNILILFSHISPSIVHKYITRYQTVNPSARQYLYLIS